MRNRALAYERDRHRMGADPLARDAAGGVGCTGTESCRSAFYFCVLFLLVFFVLVVLVFVVRSGTSEGWEDMSTLLAALVAFLKEHQHCGDLDGAVEDDHVWLTCTSGAAIRR